MDVPHASLYSLSITHTVDSTPIFATPNRGDRVLLMSPASPQPPSDKTKPRDDEHDGKEDLFAPLFSPPTPPASPRPAPVFGAATTTSNIRLGSSGRSRNFSTSSGEFGSFVSVPATDDPLHADQHAAFSLISPTTSLEFFDQFADHAAKSNAQRRQVLDELLLHEDDPLYSVNDTSGPTPDSDALQTDMRQLRLSHSLVPPIPEEPDSSNREGTGGVSDRYVNEFSK